MPYPVKMAFRGKGKKQYVSGKGKLRKYATKYLPPPPQEQPKPVLQAKGKKIAEGSSDA